VAVAPVTMTMMSMTVMTMAMMTVTVVATMLAAGGRRCDRSRSQGESGDGSEGNLTKHPNSPFQA
jgi:hypothetical protein